MGGVASVVLSRVRGVHVAGAMVGAVLWVFSRFDCDIHTKFARIKRNFYKNKVVWVTGASSGIGKALCLRLARLEAHLIVSARSEAVLNKLSQELLALGARSVHVVPVDLALGEDESVDAARRALSYHGDKLDCLINNAGVSTRATAAALELDSVRSLMELNFFAPVILARECLQPLARANGIIINTSSISSVVATPLRSSYAASKAALDRYFTSFSYENPTIHVMSLCPGSTQSNVSRNALAPGGTKWGKMDEAIQHGLPADRVAERALAAAACGISVAWIAQPRELFATRIAGYAPDLWQIMAPLAFRGYAQRLESHED